MLKKIAAFLFLMAAAFLPAKIIQVTAAEGFYGEIAKRIGGPYIQVTSIMNNPNQDPHLFSSNSSIIKSIANADLIIYNGIDYDPWMENLVKVNAKENSFVIVVAELIGKKPGDNPHIWYDPYTMPVYAKELTADLAKIDPEHKSYFANQLSAFQQDYGKLSECIIAFKKKYDNVPVIATEPVFNDMASALGLKMYGEKFQLSIMNDVSPSVSDTKDFEDRLKTRKVRALIYNNQVINPITERMQRLAQKSGVPIVGVSETQPSGQSFVDWMVSQIKNLETALANF